MKLVINNLFLKKNLNNITEINSVTIGIILICFKVVMYLTFYIGDIRILNSPTIFNQSMDGAEYLVPMNNYFDYGTYSLSANGIPYAGRLPGFIFPYMLFRFFFNSTISFYLLGLFILIMSIVAGIVSSKFIYNKTKSIGLVVFSLFVLHILQFYWHNEWALHPNSLGLSIEIIIIYYLDKYFTKNISKNLFIIGILSAWLFFLRGFTLLIIPIIFIILMIHYRKNSFSLKKIILNLLIFISPLCIIEGIWITRNYIYLHEFIPLQTSFVPNSKNSLNDYSYGSVTKNSMMDLREFISCWGGENFWYFQNSDMNWFIKKDSYIKPSEKFNPIVFKSGITDKDMQQLKSLIVYSFEQNLNPSQHDSIENLISIETKKLTKQFKSNSIWYYYLVSPFNRIKNMIVKNPTQDWPGERFSDNNIFQKCIKLISIGCYIFLLISFVLLIIFKTRTILSSQTLLLLFSYTICILVMFAFIFNTTHFSYFMYSYMPAWLLVFCLLPKIFKKKSDEINT